MISHFVRLISLSARLFANILAGHLLILIMGGGLAVLLGLAVLGVATLPARAAFFIFEVGLVATLQAFIFSDSVRYLPRRRDRRDPLGKELTQWTTDTDCTGGRSSHRPRHDAARAIALGVGTGLGSIGAGIGVGYIFGKTIESVTRQPEMKESSRASVARLRAHRGDRLLHPHHGLIAFFLT